MGSEMCIRDSNSRLDAIQAAILNVKLPKLNIWINQRKKIAAQYIELLNEVPGLQLPRNFNQVNSFHAWNQFVIRVTSFPNKRLKLEDNNKSFGIIEGIEDANSLARDILKEGLQGLGVNTIIYYPIPIHLQPAYKKLGYEVSSLPITEKLCGEVLSLPIFPEISFDQQKYVVQCLKRLMDS